MRKTLWIASAALLCIVIAVHLFDIPVREGVGRVVNTAGVELNKANQGVKKRAQFIFTSESPEKEELQYEVNRLRVDNLELQRLREENQQLRQELSFEHSSDLETTPADVVSYNPDSTRDKLRINIGSNQGIKAGMPVIAKSALVGKVDKVYNSTADILLITDISSRALTEVESGEEGVLKGQIGGGLVLEQLPGSAGIDVGDTVSTSGRDGTYPPGILVGSINSIVQTPGEVFDSAQVAPAISHRDLQVVLVVTGL